jgi:hypothetical protein
LWQKIATGPLGWTPATFWSATLPELLTALDGKFPSSKSQPLSVGEKAALEAGFRAKQEKRRKRHATP